jgi:hypothetical protein
MVRNAGTWLLTEDGVGGVQRGLVHGSLADESLRSGERYAGGREAVALVVGYDLPAVPPPHGDARVRRPQVDADRRAAALELQAGRHLPLLRNAKPRAAVVLPVPARH